MSKKLGIFLLILSIWAQTGAAQSYDNPNVICEDNLPDVNGGQDGLFTTTYYPGSDCATPYLVEAEATNVCSTLGAYQELTNSDQSSNEDNYSIISIIVQDSKMYKCRYIYPPMTGGCTGTPDAVLELMVDTEANSSSPTSAVTSSCTEQLSTSETSSVNYIWYKPGEYEVSSVVDGNDLALYNSLDSCNDDVGQSNGPNVNNLIAFVSRKKSCGINVDYRVESKYPYVQSTCNDDGTVEGKSYKSSSCDASQLNNPESSLSVGYAKCYLVPGGLYAYSSCSNNVTPTTACAAGSILAEDGTTCEQCGRGKYASAGATSCSDCPVKNYNPIDGWGSCFPCDSALITGSDYCIVASKCAAGEYKDGLSCQPCGVGQYLPSSDESLQGACFYCEPGKYSSSVGSSTCVSCEANFYQDELGQGHCKTCNTAREVGSVVCPVAVPTNGNCFPGSVNAGSGRCEPCPIGKYKDDSEASCKDCSDGKTTLTVGSVNDAQCFVKLCDQKGTFYRTVTDSCEECPKGSYQDIPGTATNNNVGVASCKSCPSDKPYTEDPGSTSVSDCMSDKTNCSPGYYILDGSELCLPCPAGTMGDATGAVKGIQGCKRCGKDQDDVQMTSTPGKTECTATTNPNTPCQMGYYNDGDSSDRICKRCPINTFSNANDSAACYACPEGTVAPAGSTKETDCVPSGGACPAGTYGSQCTPCPVGTWSSAHVDLMTDCKSCPGGTSAPFGSTAASACGMGSSKYCPLGSQAVSIPVGTTCRYCPANTYGRLSMEGDNTCEQCDTDFASPVGSTSPTSCKLTSQPNAPTQAPTTPDFKKRVDTRMQFNMQSINSKTFGAQANNLAALNLTIMGVLEGYKSADMDEVYVWVESITVSAVNNVRRRLAAADSMSVQADIVGIGGSAQTIQTFTVSSLTAAINTGFFDSSLTENAISLNANDLSQATSSAPVEVFIVVTDDDSDDNNGGENQPNKKSDDTGSNTGAAVGGSLGAIIFIGGCYWYWTWYQKQLAEAVAAQASTRHAGNPMLENKSDLPPHWTEKKTLEGKSYYHNSETGAVQEEEPIMG